jgi:hypothetical protein
MSEQPALNPTAVHSALADASSRNGVIDRLQWQRSVSNAAKGAPDFVGLIVASRKR